MLKRLVFNVDTDFCTLLNFTLQNRFKIFVREISKFCRRRCLFAKKTA